MNTFFLNPAKNLKISEIEQVNRFAEKTSHLMLKLIFKYSKQPSFVAINNITKGLMFHFLSVSVDDVFKKIKKLNKIIKKKFLHISQNKMQMSFSDYICNFFNNVYMNTNFQIS